MFATQAEIARSIAGALSRELDAAELQRLDAVPTDDLEAYESATQNLMQASHKLAEILYQDQQAQGAPDGAPGGDASASPAADDDVIDAEYVDADKT